jgi:3-methyladenine DNA glycosylase AlkD
MYEKIVKELEDLKNPDKAKILSRFFKTWKWEYGEWDKFLWIPVPPQREIAKKYYEKCSLDDIEKLVKSEYHEVRMTWFLILCYKYELAKKKKLIDDQKNIIDFYLSHLEYSNNWDLVDLVCYKILWNYLLDKDRNILYELAEDENMWKQRVAIVSTMTFVKKWEFEDTLKISEMLLNHKHDLIHKAVGWLLREVWKKDEKVLKDFLGKYANKMPRTMLRYAIEKLNESERKYYLNLQN